MIPFLLPENKIVFTTTDGVGLKKGDSYWYIIKAKIYQVKIISGQDFPKGNQQFSSKDKALAIL
jgi:hypothetical protein